MISRIILVIVGMVCSLAYAGNKDPSAVTVITEKFTGVTVRDKEAFTFLPGELVIVMQSNNQSSLIESVPRDWATTGGVWVPRKILTSQRSFTKVEKWPGERHIETVAGDYVADYSIDSAGDFRIKTFDEKGRSHVVRGHMYKFRNIYWLKANSDSMSPTDLFFLMSDGKLCWLTPVDECSQ